MSEEKDKLFYCYSGRLANFIKAFGINYDSRGVNPVTNRVYRTFVRTDKLCAVLDFWDEVRWKFECEDESVDNDKEGE